MQYSVIFLAQLASSTPPREQQLFADLVEQAVFAETVGFDRLWAVEHHALEGYAHLSAPEVFLAYVAARTERIRLGHGVVCMPFGYNHPVRVAERVATLDVLSGGRLDVGGGRGATVQEMSLMGVDPAVTQQELEEALRMLGHMWEKDEFEWHGLLDIAPHPIIPRPVQQPHPPLFMACTRQESVELAAAYGVGALVFGFAGPDDIAGMRRRYDDAIADRTGDRLVSSVVNDHLAALCPTVVLDDADAAVRIGARGQRYFAQAIAHWYADGPPPDETDIDGVVDVEMRAARERYLAHLHEAKIPVGPRSADTFELDQAYGDAAAAVRHVERLAAAGADEIICLVQLGTVPHEVCMETLRQWGETVIPATRALR